MARQRRRHVPQRTCIGCRQVQPKGEMIRVVRTSDEGVVVDPTGKRAGRGAYLCPRQPCWETALSRGQLEQSLRTRLTPQERDALMAFGAAYASSSDSLLSTQAGTGERVEHDVVDRADRSAPPAERTS